MSAALLSPADVRDSLGREFDAAKFRVDGSGQPRFDRLGRFVNLRGGRKPKAASAAGPADRPAAPAAPAADPEPAAVPDFGEVDRIASAASSAASAADAVRPGQNESGPAASAGGALVAELELENIAAETAIGIVQTALCLIGDEEGLLTPLEKKMLRRPLDRVLAKYNIGADTLPAELELAVVCGTLVINRLQKPKTQTWFQRVKRAVGDWWMGRKGAAAAKVLRREVGPVGPASAEREAAE